MSDRSTVTNSTMTGSAAGVITRRTLPAPADITVYELTGVGRALQPALHELLNWGLRYGPEPSQDDASQPGAQQSEPPTDPAQPAVTAKDTNDSKDPDDNSSS